MTHNCCALCAVRQRGSSEVRKHRGQAASHVSLALHRVFLCVLFILFHSLHLYTLSPAHTYSTTWESYGSGRAAYLAAGAHNVGTTLQSSNGANFNGAGKVVVSLRACHSRLTCTFPPHTARPSHCDADSDAGLLHGEQERQVVHVHPGGVERDLGRRCRCDWLPGVADGFGSVCCVGRVYWPRAGHKRGLLFRCLGGCSGDPIFALVVMLTSFLCELQINGDTNGPLAAGGNSVGIQSKRCVSCLCESPKPSSDVLSPSAQPRVYTARNKLVC